tara:strand:- start:55 stop:432 length:378 start_codon:yes stop_codon:yes gene_type:complete
MGQWVLMIAATVGAFTICIKIFQLISKKNLIKFSTYLKARKRNAVLAILLFLPFKALIYSLFWGKSYYQAISRYLFPDLQIWGWDDVKKESIVIGYNYDNLIPWIVSAILFAMIIYAFHDKIKAR